MALSSSSLQNRFSAFGSGFHKIMSGVAATGMAFGAATGIAAADDRPAGQSNANVVQIAMPATPAAGQISMTYDEVLAASKDRLIIHYNPEALGTDRIENLKAFVQGAHMAGYRVDMVAGGEHPLKLYAGGIDYKQNTVRPANSLITTEGTKSISMLLVAMHNKFFGRPAITVSSQQPAPTQN